MDDFHVEEGDFFEVLNTAVFVKTEMVPGAKVAKAHLRLTEGAKRELKQFRVLMEYRETIEIPGHSKRLSLRGTMDGLVDTIGSLLDDLEQAGC